LQLSLGFPIRLGVAILYAPATAAAIALVGTFDPREIRGRRRISAALFDRCQIALSVLAGSSLFHALADLKASSLWIVLPVVLLATTVDYCVNVALVASYMRLASGVSFVRVLSELRMGAIPSFLMSYLGLSLVGVLIARLYLDVNWWSVLVFILPLVFGRQMFFRTMALEEATKELKDREQVLRALSNRMAEERHDERMQIAGYLHDDLAQMLFRMTLQVEMAKKRLAQSDLTAVAKDLDGIASTKQQANDMVRALIRDLHRSPIGRAGLAEALTSFAIDAQTRFETQVIVDVEEVTLPPPIQLLIYQIAREAAQNALKHAEGEHVWISIHDTGDGVQLQIRDDGKGFDTEAPPPEGHFGSVMMRERAVVAGGTFSITSSPGRGSLVTATFPRVWVEEGSLHEAEESARGESSKAPVGASTGHAAAPLDPPMPAAPASGNGNGHGSIRRLGSVLKWHLVRHEAHDDQASAEVESRDQPAISA